VLRWQNQWSAHLKIWQKQFDEGRTPPKPFFERPEVEPHLHDYWLAFLDLTTERQSGMGAGPIPRSKIRDYASNECGLSGDEHESFCLVMVRVDEDYTSMVNSTSKDKSAVPIDDVEGVKGVFDLIERRKEKEEKHKAGRKV
jgi:hypothetical protein